MCISKNERGNARTYDQDDITFGTAGFLNQPRKEYTPTPMGAIIPWIPLQFSRDNDSSSTGEDPKIKFKDSSATKRQQTEIMPMDSEPYWEGDSNDIGNW
jgi:hypothetical protein